MAVFTLWKNEKGTAEYRQVGSKVSFRVSADGMFDGAAPKEIHITAPNLAAVPEAKAPEPKKAEKSEPAKATKAPKAKKGAA